MPIIKSTSLSLNTFVTLINVIIKQIMALIINYSKRINYHNLFYSKIASLGTFNVVTKIKLKMNQQKILISPQIVKKY